MWRVACKLQLKSFHFLLLLGNPRTHTEQRMEFKLGSLLAPLRWMYAIANVFKNGGAYRRLQSYVESNKAFVCEMQGWLATFMVNGSERHNQLRLAVEAFQRSTSPQTQQVADLEAAMDAMTTFVDHHLACACQKVFTALDQHFAPRYRGNLYKPRFCVKLRERDGIYTLARNGGEVEKQEIRFEAARNGNSGFEFVAKEGKPFFENNLPVRAKAGVYKNPRLDVGKVARYSASLWDRCRSYFVAGPIDDVRWMECWTNGGGQQLPPALSCYKSTVIVPMTLLHHQVDHEFIHAFGTKSDKLPADSSKYNFGFLCADCHHTEFFEEHDKVCLFVHADLFCLFLIQAYSYREHSPTFAAAEIELEKLKAAKKRIAKSNHRRNR